MKREELTIGGLPVVALGDAGPNALFLHGGPGVYGYIETLCETVSSFCRPFFYNQRGSREAEADIGIQDHISDLKNISDQLFPDSSATLIGHSWGAMLAILFASEHPDHVKKLIVVGTGPLDCETAKEFTREILERFGEQRGYFDELWKSVTQERDEERQRLLANKYIREIVPFYQNSEQGCSALSSLRWDFEASRRTMRESDAFVELGRYTDALSEIGCPMTVIHGSNDPLSSGALFPLILEHQPLARLCEVEGAGHYPWVGQGSGEFFNRLKREMAENDSEAP